MKRNREERLKSSGTHHLFISPYNSEESGGEKAFNIVVPFLPFIEILYLIS